MSNSEKKAAMIFSNCAKRTAAITQDEVYEALSIQIEDFEDGDTGVLVIPAGATQEQIDKAFDDLNLVGAVQASAAIALATMDSSGTVEVSCKRWKAVGNLVAAVDFALATWDAYSVKEKDLSRMGVAVRKAMNRLSTVAANADLKGL